MNTTPDFAVELPVLGIAVRFATNSATVLSMIEESFGRWRGTPVSNDTPLRVNLTVHAGSEHVNGRAPVQVVSTDANRLLIQSPGSMAVVEALRHESVAYVTEELVADRDHFRITFLEAITFALIAPFDRHPVHAAALVRDGRSILLAAPAGTGKSTIAYLAHANGIEVLSDDLVWVQLEPSLRIWGGRTSVRLLDDARARFPELAIASAPSGFDKAAVQLGNADDMHRDACSSAVVCVLERGPRASLHRLEANALVDELMRQLAPGFDRFPERQPAVMRALTSGGGWKLTLSNNPWDALPYLTQML